MNRQERFSSAEQTCNAEYCGVRDVVNRRMKPQRRAIGVAALVGFLACTSWSAGLVPSLSACCSTSCEPCPVVICKSTAVSTSLKADAAYALPPSGFSKVEQPFAAAPIATLAQIPAFLPPEFRRPMRN